jgi:PQQ-dependent dehydrogenase (methanol/ethanol family)
LRLGRRVNWIFCLLALCTGAPEIALAADINNFTPLSEINTGNVNRMKLLFSFRSGQTGGQSGAPAVAGDLLLLQTAFPHTLYALDIHQQAAPARWSFTPPSDRRAAGLTCCDATVGGPVVADGQVVLNTLDGHTIALDAATGQVRWDVVTASLDSGETLSTSPSIAGDRVIIGGAGDDFGARGWIAGLDPHTGATVWKRFNTGPEEDVGIGAGFNSPYPRDQSHDGGVTTWPPQAWQQGGGGLAGNLAYDSDRGILLYGTGHPAPWNPDPRPGDNKWTSGLFARDARTGDARWFVSISPHDLYALGAAGSVLLADTQWQGRDRNLLIHPDANGQVYVLDRGTGAILSAAPFVPINATQGVDTPTGTLRRNVSMDVSPNAVTRDICPGWPGATGADGTSLGAAALSPQTRLLYIPANRLCMDMEPRDTSFMSGTPFIGANLRMKAAPGFSRGALIAWEVSGARPVWTVAEDFPVHGGVLATAGGVVFYGTLDGAFKAVDARDGHLLWQFHASSGIIGQPITFRLADGHQYIAITAGTGGPAGRVAEDGIDPRDATAAHGYANALRDLKPPADPSGVLYVFALP